MEIVYAQAKHPLSDGRAYSNPRFFTSPAPGVTKVYLVGDWPKIRAAYTALGVPVEQVGDFPPPIRRAAAVEAHVTPLTLTPALPVEERSSVYIPEDWRELNYNRPKPGRDVTLRGIAAMLSETPVINRERAVAAIEGEIQRRMRATSPMASSDDTASNGLTRREMNADLAAKDIEINPGLAIEDLARLHAELRTAKGA